MFNNNNKASQLDYSINVEQPKNDVDATSNMDMISDIQSGLANDVQPPQVQQGQQQANVLPPIGPLDNSQRSVMPK